MEMLLIQKAYKIKLERWFLTVILKRSVLFVSLAFKLDEQKRRDS